MLKLTSGVSVYAPNDRVAPHALSEKCEMARQMENSLCSENCEIIASGREVNTSREKCQNIEHLGDDTKKKSSNGAN